MTDPSSVIAAAHPPVPTNPAGRALLTLEEYLAELLALVEPDLRTEQLTLDRALYRVIAGPVTSRVSIPAFANSAMDGYAVRFADVADVPVRLPVVGEVPAGSADDPPARPGECVRIMTGAPVPSFADTVVPLEDTDPDRDTVLIRLAPAQPGAHVRGAGEDIVTGTRVAAAGASLSPALLGALAAAGVVKVAVRPRPVVALCATGDELVVDGSPLRRGQIYESNAVALGAALARDGADVRRGPVLGDRPDDLAAWLAVEAVSADLVVLTGGVSVGAYDVVRDVLTERAGGTFRQVRIQPGKPQGWAVWPGGAPVVALPGNPLSAALSYEVFVRPLLDRRVGRPAPEPMVAVAATGWTSPPGRRQLVPVRLSVTSQGRLTASPAHPRGSASHTVTALAAADGFALVAEDVTTVAPGDPLDVRWLR